MSLRFGRCILKKRAPQIAQTRITAPQHLKSGDNHECANVADKPEIKRHRLALEPQSIE